MSEKLLLIIGLFLLLSCLLQMRFNLVEAQASNSYPVHNLDTDLNYTTIQEAISAPETLNGHTIKVDAGIYYEHITISKSITLVGGCNNTAIIDGNETGTIIEIVANYVSISNFTIRNAGPNWQPSAFDACVFGKYVHDIYVENNVLQNAGNGIAFGESSLVNISNNIISNIVFLAVDVGSWLDIGLTRNVTVSDNRIYNTGGSGINVDGDSEYCKIVNNTVENCSLGIDLAPNVNSLIVPSDNLIDGNVLSNNSEANIWIMGANGQSQERYTNSLRRNNLTNSQFHNLIIWGFNLASFMQDIDSSNIVNNKRIYYLTNCGDFEISPLNHPDAGYLALVNCTNVTVKDFCFAENKDGLLLAGSTGCTLANMTIGNNRFYVTEMNVTLPSHWGGLTFFESSNNTIENCEIYNCSYGVCLYHSDLNLFCHNSFVSNDKHVVSDYYYPFQDISSGYFSTNTWDNGLEGNYWSNYTGVDLNHDGIGDMAHLLHKNNTDSYPLMGMFHSFNTSLGHSVNVISNSTLENFEYFESNSTIKMHVSNITSNQTFGFCRICISHALMNVSTISVIIDNGSTPVLYDNYTLYDNGTHRWIYFAYQHSTHEVVIIPEFPSFLLLPLFMIATLLAVIVYKRKHIDNDGE